MTLDQWYSANQGQSLLYNTRDASLRGQCVQSVCFIVQQVYGLPVMWKDASEWWYQFSLPGSYDRIANTATAVPQRGDVIIWDRNLPNSGGAGHIAVCWEPRPGTGTFVSIDQNWGGKTVHLVTHNYSYVIGWLRPKVAAPAPPPPPPAPAPPAPQSAPATSQGDEMITSSDQASKIYRMLRPNGGANQDEINGTVNRRSYAQFVNDAANEVAARDANLSAQAAHLAELQTTINQLNQTVTDNQVKDSASFADYQAKVADLTAQLSTAHDKIAQLQTKSVVPAPVVPPVTTTTTNAATYSLIAKVLAVFLKKQ